MTVGVGLRYENTSRAVFSFFETRWLNSGFLPKSLFLICSNWNERASILVFWSLFLSSSSLILCLNCLICSSNKTILFLALGYICSRLLRRMSLCLTSSVESELTPFILAYCY